MRIGSWPAAGLLAVLLLLTVAAAPAGAQYDPKTGGLQVSPVNPPREGTVVVTGTGFGFDVPVEVAIESERQVLAHTVSDGSGAISLVVRMPAGFEGQHTLTATGPTTEGKTLVLSASVVIGAAADALPRTGADSVPLVQVGIAAIIVGALLLLARRRRAAAPVR